MSDTVLYIRGGFPFPGVEIPDGLIRDAKVLLGLDIELLESVRHSLETYEGFLDRGALQQVLASRIEDPELCRALGRLIVNIDEHLRRTSRTIEQLLQQIEQWLQEEENQQKGLLSAEELEELRGRMQLVIRPYPGLNRQAKARRLSEATGLPLEKVDIICDLRPVFDKDRENVEGIIPYTTLRIVCTGADGLPVALDAVLSQQDVAQLAKASSDAQKKLAKLKALLHEKKLPIPHIDMTMEDEER